MIIRKNIPLAPYTTFKTGGVAKFFCEIRTSEDLTESLRLAKKEKLKIFILGGGSNLLINDGGFNGLVIRLVNNSVEWKDTACLAEAGIRLNDLISSAKEKNRGGMEWAYGIPATLGGAARNNAGAFGCEFSNQIDSVRVFDLKKEDFITVEKKDCDYSYRHSVFQKNPDWIIWQVSLAWEKCPKEQIEKNILSYLKKRKESQPLEYPSAGSFFRNPPISHLEKDKKNQIVNRFIQDELKKTGKKENSRDFQKAETELREKINKSGTLPAGYFIEKAGLKGRAIGGVLVSNKHANFIINTGNAKTEDIAILASIIKQKVRTKFGIQLHEEVEYVGF